MSELKPGDRVRWLGTHCKGALGTAIKVYSDDRRPGVLLVDVLWDQDKHLVGITAKKESFVLPPGRKNRKKVISYVTSTPEEIIRSVGSDGLHVDMCELVEN